MKGNKTWKSIRKAFHSPFTTSRIWCRRCRSDDVIKVGSYYSKPQGCSTEFHIISHKICWAAVQWLLVWNWSGLPQIRGSRYPQISPIFTSGWYCSSKWAAFCLSAEARYFWGVYLSCGGKFLWAVWFLSAGQRYPLDRVPASHKAEFEVQELSLDRKVWKGLSLFLKGSIGCGWLTWVMNGVSGVVHSATCVLAVFG